LCRLEQDETSKPSFALSHTSENAEHVYAMCNNLLCEKGVVAPFADTYIQKAKKTYMDNRGRRNLSALNTELQDVQRIMVQNIDDVLQRGAVLSGE
jgi:hypothetical protein